MEEECMDEMSYNQALAELQKIVETLQNPGCDVDRMVDLTRRATGLLALCRSRLTTTEQQLQAALAALTAPAS